MGWKIRGGEYAECNKGKICTKHNSKDVLTWREGDAEKFKRKEEALSANLLTKAENRGIITEEYCDSAAESKFLEGNTHV